MGGFKSVHASVRTTPVAPSVKADGTVRRVCEAVTMASCFYWKPVLCLPRAVVTTRLLRKFGVHGADGNRLPSITVLFACLGGG